jgi:hypothetical protein
LLCPASPRIPKGPLFRTIDGWTTPVRIQLIRAALDAGHGLREIARLLKVSATKVREVGRISASDVGQPGIRSNFFRVVEVCKTHGCALEQKTSMLGSNMLGSSNDPARTSVSPGITSTSATMPEPQFGQNRRCTALPESAISSKVFNSPWTFTS